MVAVEAVEVTEVTAAVAATEVVGRMAPANSDLTYPALMQTASVTDFERIHLR